MSVTAVLLMVEVMPTAGVPGETPLQGQMSVVVTLVSMPGSGAHCAWATPSIQRRGPGEGMSTGGHQAAGHGPPSASCSPGPLRGLEPGPQGDRACGGHVPEVWATVCKGRLGAQLASHRALAGGVDAAL